MIFEAIAFYAFAGIAILSALSVIAARNPVHSVLFLILTFFSAAGLFVLLGAEFLALILVVVYVGAVAVLFLFVVMMLNIDFAEMRKGLNQYLPVGAFTGLVVLGELILIVGALNIAPESSVAPSHPIPLAGETSNTAALGQILYTDYIYLFQASGLILLVAMIGAIVLTLRHREGVKKQNIYEQVSRKREEGVELIDVTPGQGI